MNETAQQLERAPLRDRRWPRMRWVIAGMLFLAASLNYIDRQTLSLLAPTIQKDLHISDDQYGRIASLFLLAYTISLLLSGRLVDKLGARLSMALFIGWWSVSNVLTGWARSLRSLAGFRFSLGLGEAGNWPAATKAVAEWFPPAERGAAIGFYTVGASIGATVAPWIILTAARGRHWQWAFALTGGLGLLWIVPWLWIARSPGRPATAPDEAPAGGPVEPELRRWARVLGRADVWLLLIARMLTDPVWFFYQFWFAKYLFSARHVPQQKLGLTWVIFLASDFGGLLGGIASGWLIKRGKKPVSSRMYVMLACALLAPLSPLVAWSPSLTVCLGLGSVVVFAHMAWLSNITALIIDVIPRGLVATAFGVIAAGSAVGGMQMNSIVAGLADHHAYTTWFVIAAFLHPAAWLLLWAWTLTRRADA